MNHPLLYLGMIGFAPEERKLVAEVLRKYYLHANTEDGEPQQPLWELVDYREADALLINGAGAVRADDHMLHFHSRLSVQNEPMAVNLVELQAPCAIQYGPMLQHLRFPSSCLVDAQLLEPQNLIRCIQRFDLVLRPLRSIYALAAQLTRRHEELDEQRCQHLEHNGFLEAIVDCPQRRVKIRSSVNPSSINNATWLTRPRQANFAPQDFLTCHMEEVTWLFAMHTPAFTLPSRYNRKTIYLRRAPRVRPSMLYRRHAYLLEVLASQPNTYQELRNLIVSTQVPENPGQESTRLDRDLFALYLCRAITTEPQRMHVSSLSMTRRNLPPDAQLEETRPRFSAFNKHALQLSTLAADL